MKAIIFLLLLSTFYVSAASQCEYSVNEIDVFTNHRKVVSSAQTICIDKPDFIDISLSKVCDSSSCLTSLQIIYRNPAKYGDSKCFGHDSYVILLFEDGSKLKLEDNIYNADCGYVIGALFEVNFEEVNKKLKAIRIKFSEGYTDYDIKMIKRNGFANGRKNYDASNCLIDAVECINSAPDPE